MRARVSTRLGIWVMVGLWTILLGYVIFTLFVRAPEIQSTVEQVDEMIKPSTDILVELARYHGQGDNVSRANLERALHALDKDPRFEDVSPTQIMVVGEGRRWLNGEVDETRIFRAATVELVQEARQLLLGLHTSRNQTYIIIFIACLALLNALFFLRYVVLYLVDPLEEVFHFMESRRPAAEMPPYQTLPAVAELATIQDALRAFVEERHAYVKALHQHVPFGDQQAVEILLDHIPRPLWVIDREGGILAANDPAIDVLASSDGPRVRDQLYRFVPFFAANHDNLDTDAMLVPDGWGLNIATDGEAMLCILEETEEEA